MLTVNLKIKQSSNCCCLGSRVLLLQPRKTNPNFYDVIIFHYQIGLFLRVGLILKLS